MAFDFTDYRIIVAGGSQGIGRAIALGFAQAGARVSVCARHQAPLDALRDEAADQALTLLTGTCDVGNKDSLESYLADALEALGGLDVLVNCASGFGRNDDEQGWATSLDVDLLGTVRAIHACLPALAQSAHPSVINLASISALRASPRTPPYGAVKAAVAHYTATLALELAPQGIRVNGIAPGSIEFPGGVWDRARQHNPELYQRTLASIPFGRMGSDQDVARVALFLASDYAGWITGQTLVADGGQMLG